MSVNPSHKRRLELMPEVLPSPTAVLPTTSVRARTMARMRALAAVGASVAAACTGGIVDGTGGGGGGGPDGGLPDATRPDAGDPYGVVDPLPRPVCFSYATPPTAKGMFGDGSDAGPDASSNTGDETDVTIDLTWNQANVVPIDVKSQDPRFTLTSQTPNANGLRLVLHGPRIPTSFSIGFSVSCASGPTQGTVDAALDPDSGVVSTDVQFSGG